MFAQKIDYCGLTAITELAAALLIRDDNENGSVEKYQPNGGDGSFLGTEVFGQDSAPTNAYGLKADLNLAAGKIKLNKITTVDGKNYALESIEIATAGGSAVKISATCQEIEAGATDAAQAHCSVPALKLSKLHIAQILFDAFTLTGTGCTLTECKATIGSTINKDKVEGVKISSDINSAVITVSGTILQSGSTAPTIEAATGWVITQPLNRTNPESAYKSYAFELQLVLPKTQPTPPSNGGGSQTT